MSDQDGGPAFPGEGMEEHVKGAWAQSVHVKYTGMSLRDWFAGMAMQGFCACPEVHGSASDISKWSYEHADAMLAERARK